MFEIIRKLVTILLFLFTGVWAIVATVALFAKQDGAFELAVVALLWCINLNLVEINNERLE
jgi:hypothetical protein